MITRIIKELGGQAVLMRCMGISRATAHVWSKRNAIPARYWGKLIRVCRTNKVPLTAKDLTAHHDIYKDHKDAM